jgi:hypothetical protein
MNDRLIIVPIDFPFEDHAALERSFAPTAMYYWGVVGIWLSCKAGHHVIEHMGPKDQSIPMRGVDAACYDAAPRLDGLPRHVVIDAPLVTSDEPFILAIKPRIVSLASYPSVTGHLLVNPVRAQL